MPDNAGYRQTIAGLSARLVEAQRPIRILDAVKWDASIQQAFFAGGCTELPPVDAAYYDHRPPAFDVEAKRAEFLDLEQDIAQALGTVNPVGVIMRRMCREYESVVRMIGARGRPEFARLARQLYGSAHDAFHADHPTLADFGDMMAEALSHIDRSAYGRDEDRTIPASDAVAILQERLDAVFSSVDVPIRVMISDGIVADAAAGADYLKLRQDALFNERDLKLLELHEGWVHLGTTLNGRCQPVCTFLGVGPPSSTVTQEGLAILMEVIGLASHPRRLRRLTNRIKAIQMAEAGANFLDVFSFYRESGLPDAECYAGAVRVFRGSTPDGGPFAKDYCYSRGFVLVYNFIQLAVRKGLLDRLPLLFCGKTTLEDVRTLRHLLEEGVLIAPRFLPPLFRDMRALAAWLCFTSFTNHISVERIEADYSNLM